jgi:hypothetical protein
MNESTERDALGNQIVPRDVRVATPVTWFDFDLDPETSRRSIIQFVEERAGRSPDREQIRRELQGWLEQATADARSQGAVFASVLADTVERQPVGACLIASLARDDGPGLGDDRARVEALAGRLARLGGPLAGIPIGVRELPAGSAVRSRRRATIDSLAFDGHPVEVESLQYFVLIPGTTDVLLLSFSTPNLGLADAMVELFDATAESLQWRW